MWRRTTLSRGAVALVALLVPAAWGGETGWREIRAPHVVLRTDLNSRDAREAALTVERYRAELIAAAWPRANFPMGDAIEMTAFAGRGDFEHYFTRRVTGVFFHDLPPQAVMWGAADGWEQRKFMASPETTSILRHELTHHLAASIFRRQPRWFSEGLAQFLETIRPTDDRKSVVIGVANYEALTKYTRRKNVNVSQALSWKGKLDSRDPRTTSALYGVSWAMVHWLFNEHSDQFVQLQALLAKGIDSDKAWKVILPALGAPNVDEALANYVHNGKYQEFHIPLPPLPDLALTERPLSEADVHATRANVAFHASLSVQASAELRSEADQELTTALQLEPKNLLAEQLQIRLVPPPQRAALARKLTVEHPDDGQSWLVLSQMLGPDSPDERWAAVSRAVELLPDNPRALNSKAWLLLKQGKAAEAAAPATRAVALAPYSPQILDTLAAVQAALGRCTEAVATQERAVELLPEQATAGARQSYEGKLTEYQTSCVSGSPPATANAPVAPAAPPGNPTLASPPQGK
jgi:tetratricopeptide (TPR) repeat protein